MAVARPLPVPSAVKLSQSRAIRVADKGIDNGGNMAVRLQSGQPTRASAVNTWPRILRAQPRPPT